MVAVLGPNEALPYYIHTHTYAPVHGANLRENPSCSSASISHGKGHVGRSPQKQYNGLPLGRTIRYWYISTAFQSAQHLRQGHAKLYALVEEVRRHESRTRPTRQTHYTAFDRSFVLFVHLGLVRCGTSTAAFVRSLYEGKGRNSLLRPTEADEPSWHRAAQQTSGNRGCSTTSRAKSKRQPSYIFHHLEGQVHWRISFLIQEVLGRSNHLLHLTLHGPHRKCSVH
jgi:hypothetical protein